MRLPFIGDDVYDAVVRGVMRFNEVGLKLSDPLVFPEVALVAALIATSMFFVPCMTIKCGGA